MIQTILTNRSSAFLIALLLAFVGSHATAQTQSGNRSRASGKDFIVERLKLKETTVQDAAELLSEISGLNIVATEEAGKKTATMVVRDVRTIDAIETLAKVSGLWYREDGASGTVLLMTTEEYGENLVVFRDDITKVFTLLHPNALSISMAIRNLYGDRVLLSLQTFDDDQIIGTGTFAGNGLMAGGGLGGAGGGGFGGMGGMGMGGMGGMGMGGMGMGGMGMGGMGMGGMGMGGMGMGGMGMGGMGMGGGTGFGAGRFSRGTGDSGMQFMQSPLFSSNPLMGDALSAQQLADIQQRVRSLEGTAGSGGVSAEVIREVAQREPPIYVSYNRTHSLVIVRTSDGDAMKSIERLVMELDRPTPEVLLEMKILQVRLTDNFRSILDVQFNNGRQGPLADQQVSRNPFLTEAATAAQDVFGLVNSPETVGAGSLIYQFLNDNLRARLEVLQQNDQLTRIASPVLLSSNNRPARIFIGQERVLVTGINTGIVTPAAGATTTVIQPVTEIRDIGTTLLILPKINADRTVTVSIEQDQSEVDPKSQDLPVPDAAGGVRNFPIDSVRTQNLQATVVAKDGLTVAVGGLISDTSNVRERKVPILGDMPFIGPLFRQYIDENEKSELILLITPHVITTPTEGQMKTQMRLQALSDHPNIQAHTVCQPDVWYELDPTAIHATGSGSLPGRSHFETVPGDLETVLPHELVPPQHPWDATSEAPWRKPSSSQ